MIPRNITRQHMLNAIRSIDIGTCIVPPRQRSTRYCLVHEGERYQHYPPKIIIRWANKIANGKELWEHAGGEETNSFCMCRGFEIVRHGGAPH